MFHSTQAIHSCLYSQFLFISYIGCNWEMRYMMKSQNSNWNCLAMEHVSQICQLSHLADVFLVIPLILFSTL